MSALDYTATGENEFELTLFRLNEVLYLAEKIKKINPTPFTKELVKILEDVGAMIRHDESLLKPFFIFLEEKIHKLEKTFYIKKQITVKDQKTQKSLESQEDFLALVELKSMKKLFQSQFDTTQDFDLEEVESNWKDKNETLNLEASKRNIAIKDALEELFPYLETFSDYKPENMPEDEKEKHNQLIQAMSSILLVLKKNLRTAEKREKDEVMDFMKNFLVRSLHEQGIKETIYRQKWEIMNKHYEVISNVHAEKILSFYQSRTAERKDELYKSLEDLGFQRLGTFGVENEANNSTVKVDFMTKNKPQITVQVVFTKTFFYALSYVMTVKDHEQSTKEAFTITQTSEKMTLNEFLLKVEKDLERYNSFPEKANELPTSSLTSSEIESLQNAAE